MGRFTNGWVKIPRSLIEERWDGTLGNLFIRLLIMANYQDGQPFIRNGRVFSLLRGQVLTSLNELSKLLDVDRKTVTRYLQKLKDLGEIWDTKDRRGTVITIINYSTLQNDGTSIGIPTGTSTGTSGGIRIEEVKNLRIKEEGALALSSSELDRFLFAYEQAYLTRYTFSPLVNRVGRAAAKRVLAEVGLEKACSLIEAYLKIRNDPFFNSRAYDLITFESNLAVIEKFCQTGKHITLLEYREREKSPKF